MKHLGPVIGYIYNLDLMAFFKRKSEKEKLRIKYNQLIQESYELSHSNRRLSDIKKAEAEEVLNKIDLLS